MAKKKRKLRSPLRGRGIIKTANYFWLPRRVIKKRPRPLLVIDDRRTYYPGYRHPKTIKGLPAQIVERISRKPSKTARTIRKTMPSRLAFKIPKSTLVCIRRKTRKNIMHAIGKAGQRGQKRPRRNEQSAISCKG